MKLKILFQFFLFLWVGTNATSQTLKIYHKDVNLFSQPSFNISNKVTQVPAGSKVNYLKKALPDTTWVKVTYKDKTGYIHESVLLDSLNQPFAQKFKARDAKHFVYTNSVANFLKDEPAGNTVLKIGLDEQLNFLEESNGWALVTYKGKNYYISSTSYNRLPSAANTQSTTSSYNSSPSSNPSPIIHTGSRGGKYYINSNGKKTYVKRK